MKINLQTQGLEKVRKLFESLSKKQACEAQAKAINDAAYKVRRAMQAEITAVFDKVTPYVLRSVVVKQATPDNLVATIEPTYYGGKGVDPQLILRAQEDGGRRRDKRSEVALRKAGILPPGYQTAIPKVPYPGSDDGRGNIRGPFMVHLLSYLQAFGEQGYRANMTDRRKNKLADRTAVSSISTRKTNKMIRGVVYFVAYGNLRSGSSHLAPGIWAKTGIHGVETKPVLMFVRAGNYQPRIDSLRIAKAADLENYLPRRLRYRIRQAAGV